MSGLKLRRASIPILSLAAALVILAMAGCASIGGMKLGGAGEAGAGEIRHRLVVCQLSNQLAPG